MFSSGAKVSRLTVVLGALGVAVCGGSTGCADDEAPPEFVDPDVPGVATNPEGVPYPTDNIGGNKRNGTRRGDRMPNLTFRAYRDGDRSRGLQTMSLAEFYDPTMKRHKVLHIQIAATWCSICSSEIAATVSVTQQLKDRGVMPFEVVVAGNDASRGPALEEVDGWIARHKSDVSTAIDVRARRLATVGVNSSVVPHDFLIDTRTMEILDSSAGAPPDVGKYTLAGVAWVDANPPSY